jgi:DNA-binding GntR family transcriptional regulator
VIEWACQRITDKAAGALRSQLRKMKSAAVANDFPRYFQADLEFHRMIWAAADNPYATRALEIVMGSLFAAGLSNSNRTAAINLRAEVEKHRQLAEAICGRDAKRAAVTLLEIATGFEKHV